MNTTRLLLLFFSGTGNTQYIAESINDRLLDQLSGIDIAITMAAMEWADAELVRDTDLLCLGFPVYAGLAPENVRAFIDRLPSLPPKGVFVFDTKGMAEGNAGRDAIRRLEKKGFKPLGRLSQVMPGSDGISVMLGKDSRTFRRYLERDYGHLEAVGRFARDVASAARLLQAGGSLDEMPRRAPRNILGPLVTAVLILMYRSFGGFLAKRLRSNDRCTLCGLCARQCPAGNIAIGDGGISFGDRCLLCLRCLNNCPREAVQIGKLTTGKARWHGPGGGYDPLRYREPKTWSTVLRTTDYED